MTPYPRRVPERERPDATPENIPDNVLEEAIAIAIVYKECPYCGERQFLNTVSGETTTEECRVCQKELQVV